MSKDPGVQDEPVMDGAQNDMSDGGTPKSEVSDLMEEGRVDEAIEPRPTGHGDSPDDD